MNLSFHDLLKLKWQEKKFVCVGLDSDYDKLPESIKNQPEVEESLKIEAAIYEFNKAIIDATHDLVCAYKINSAFYEAEAQTWEAMLNTFWYIKRTYPEIAVILDAKRADIGNTNNGYVKMAFDTLKADAVTVHPYLGEKAMKPFLDHKDRGIIVLVKTSNEGSDEFQLLKLEGGRRLYEIVAEDVANINKWNYNGNCTVVVGATFPEELKRVREIVGDMTILIPGVGAQGGDLAETLKNGLNSKGEGIIISSSRAIIFASAEGDFAQRAREETEKLDKKIRGLI